MELVLLLKEKNDASVTVCTLGPESSRQVLKDALAKGADNGIFISDEGIDTSSPLNIAKTISAAIKDNNYDLVLSGLQSNDLTLIPIPPYLSSDKSACAYFSNLHMMEVNLAMGHLCGGSKVPHLRRCGHLDRAAQPSAGRRSQERASPIVGHPAVYASPSQREFQ